MSNYITTFNKACKVKIKPFLVHITIQAIFKEIRQKPEKKHGEESNNAAIVGNNADNKRRPFYPGNFLGVGAFT